MLAPNHAIATPSVLTCPLLVILPEPLPWSAPSHRHPPSQALPATREQGERAMRSLCVGTNIWLRYCRLAPEANRVNWESATNEWSTLIRHMTSCEGDVGVRWRVAAIDAS